LALRQRQIRHFLTLLILAIGTPMLSMGDEVGRSQQGNNNPYGQDHEISWFVWSLTARHAPLHRFVKELIAHRMRRDIVIGQRQLSLNELMLKSHIEWHGVVLHEPDWGESSHSFAVRLTSYDNRFRLHCIANAYWESLDFQLPPADGGDIPHHPHLRGGGPIRGGALRADQRRRGWGRHPHRPLLKPRCRNGECSGAAAEAQLQPGDHGGIASQDRFDSLLVRGAPLAFV
jgi:hypothetical protein